MALGKGQVETPAQALLQPAQSASTPGLLPEGQIRQRFPGGRLGGGGAGFDGRGGLSGTLEGIEGNTVTVNTSQGPLQATVGEDTIIQMFAQGTLVDLHTGLTVTVIGQSGEDGTVEARSIVIVPEGGAGLFGGGLSAGDRLQRGQQ